MKLEDLNQLTLALYPEEDDTIASPYFLKYFNKNLSYRLSNIESIMKAIIDNRAVGILPKKIMIRNLYLSNNLIKAISISDYQLPIHYYLIQNSNISENQAATKIIELLKKLLD